MANKDQLEILMNGPEVWNNWRKENPDEVIDLSRAALRKVDLANTYLLDANLCGADLSEANLASANLNGANLTGTNLNRTYLANAILGFADLTRANLRGACLVEADLSNADLNDADLSEADLRSTSFVRSDLNRAKLIWANLLGALLIEAKLINADLSNALSELADFSGANLSSANLSNAKLINTDFSNAYLLKSQLLNSDLTGANLRGADLQDAKLSGAHLDKTILVEANLEGANLNGCSIYGTSAWGLKLKNTEQLDLIITPPEESVITVDNIEVAQFIYLLLHNEKIRQVIDTVTSKAVLILGRFTSEHKVVLDAIREELRKRNYLPVMFDFEDTKSRDHRETITTLAHIAKFVIADITDAKSIPAELERIVPSLPSVPIMPVLLQSDKGYALFGTLRAYPWVAEPYRYKDQAELLSSLEEKIIIPAEKKVNELRRNKEIRTGAF
jgi:uncharacterized protein YjbI with pentapeptide repeats